MAGTDVYRHSFLTTALDEDASLYAVKRNPGTN